MLNKIYVLVVYILLVLLSFDLVYHGGLGALVGYLGLPTYMGCTYVYN